MKLLHHIITLNIVILWLTACESNLDKVIFDYEHATPASLSVKGNPENLYTLHASKGSEEVFTINWSKPEMGFQAAVTNILQMDLEGKHFAHAQELRATQNSNEVTYTAITNDFNAKIQTLLNSYSMEAQQVTLAFRIASVISSAADTIFSEPLTLNVLPYQGEAIYPSVAVPGQYNNWSFTNQQLYSPDDNGIYSALIYFNGKAANGWKIGTDWEATNNWGVDKEIKPEALSAVLKEGGGNIASYQHNSYKVTFNKNTLKLEMSQPHDSWGIIGIEGWGDNDDIEMTLQSEPGTDGYTLSYLSATFNVAKANTFKIRPDHQWNDQLNAGNITYEGDIKEAASDQNFELTAGSGTYTIKWYFNKVEQKIVAIKNN